MSLLALLLYGTGLVVAFGVRTWLHRRRTGSSGFSGVSGRPGSARWWAGISFVVALVLGVVALVLAVSGFVPPPRRVPGVLGITGVGLSVTGFAVVLIAQTHMGSSWRIGVDESERTQLVSGGLFGWVRNPIFSGMLTTQAGITAMVPTWLSLTALAVLIAAVQLQVRVVEEPYLTKIHGAAYRRYARAVGRFLPRVGRLRSADEERAPSTR